VNAYEVKASIGVIAGNTVWSMSERLECEVLQKARYINTLTFTFTWLILGIYIPIYPPLLRPWSQTQRNAVSDIYIIAFDK